MAKGVVCRDQAHRDAWRVRVRNGNYSAFNGGHWTPSDYSEVVCTLPDCHSRWRTNAAYVNDLPNLETEDRNA